MCGKNVRRWNGITALNSICTRQQKTDALITLTGINGECMTKLRNPMPL